MYLIIPDNTRIWTESNRNFALRQYGRLEYGSPEVEWIVPRPVPRRWLKRTLRVRLRDFLNALYRFAAFDAHGHDDT